MLLLIKKLSKRAKDPLFRSLIALFIAALVLNTMVVVEYRQNVALIDSNRALLISNAKESIKLFIEQDLSQLPANPLVLQKNWQTSPQNYYLYQNGEQKYPFTIGQDVSSRFQSLYSSYASSKALDSILSQRRRAIVQSVIEFRRAKNVASLSTAMEQLLEHKQNYRLEAVEEIVSWLQLLSANEATDWNRDVVRALLVDDWPVGESDLPSVASLLFANSAALSKKDAEDIFEHIDALAEKYEINLDQVNYFKSELYQASKLPAQLAEGYWIQDGKWLIAKDATLVQVIEADLDKRLSSVQNLLIKQGVLADKDKLYLQPLSSLSSLEDLPVSLEKESLQKARERQLLYLLTKLFALSIFTLISAFAVRQMHRNAEQKQSLVNRQEDFIRLISHELKTPVSAIRLMAETLNKRISKKMSPKDYTDRIVLESDRLESMIENIISLNQLPQAQTIEATSVYISTIVNDIADDYRERLRDNFILTLSIPENKKINTNALLLNLVLRNLFSNAEKYSRCKETVIDITYLEDDNILMFKDLGRVISHKNWERVFERFFRIAGDTSIKGMGIGLHLSRGIMRALGGDLKIVSSDKHGNIWHLCLN